MKKTIILLLTISLFVLLTPVNNGVKNIEVAVSNPPADHPIQPPV